MARMIFCTRLQKEAEGLRFQLYPGEVGKRIFDHICMQIDIDKYFIYPLGEIQVIP